MDSNMNMRNWMEGIPYEISFWKSLYRKEDSRNWILNHSTLNQNISLHNFDVASFLKGKMVEKQVEEPLLLDVGCGMSYYTGNMLDGKSLRIEYVDPLSGFYNKILKQYRANAPLIKFGMMEYLSAFYKPNSVTLVMIQNALDHSSDPVRGIMEALQVLEVGGVLYLKHYPNEAEKEQYRGFHQFNVNIRNGHLIIWNKNECHDLNELLDGYADIELSKYDNPEEIIAVITKRENREKALESYAEDIATLSNQLMIQADLFQSFAYAMKYHAKKGIVNLGHRLLHSVGQDTKNTIKRIMRKVSGGS